MEKAMEVESMTDLAEWKKKKSIASLKPKEVCYEDILEELGTTGRYQLLIFILLCSLIFSLGCHFKFMIYGGIMPQTVPCSNFNQTLILRPEMAGMSAYEIRNASSAQASDSRFARESLSGKRDFEESETRRQEEPELGETETTFLELLIQEDKVYEESGICYDIENISFYSIAAEWKLVGSRASAVSTVITVQMAGIFTGPLIAGILSDRFGRRPAIIVIATLMTIAGVAAGFSTCWEMFAAIRFFIGMFAGAALSVAFVFSSENLLGSWRVLLSCMPWPINYFFFTLTGYLTQNWRVDSFVINAPAPFAILLGIVLYESPKWLLARGRIEEAREILKKIAKMNRVDEKKLVVILDQVSECSPDLQKTVSKQKTYSYRHLFYSRDATIRCLVLVFCFAVAAGHYYCILYDLGNISRNPYMITLILAILESILNTVTTTIDFKWEMCGRRRMLMIGLVFAGVSDTILAILHGTGVSKMVPWAASIPSMSGVSLTTFFWVGAVMMSVEMFPTELRNMGNSLCNTAARVGGIAGPLIFNLRSYWAPTPFVIYALLLGVALVFAFFFLPECKNKPLPDLPKKNRNNQLLYNEAVAV